MNRLTVPVEEYTTPNPISATENTPVEEVARLMKQNGIRHIPILRDNQVVGILSDRDLRVVTSLLLKDKLQILAKDIMVTEPITVNANTSLEVVALEMSRAKIGSVIVNDENDEFLGIFTVTDALNALIEILRGEND